MTWEDVLAYCLVKLGAWQDEPWEGDVVKCGASREDADEWLLRYPDDARVMAYLGRSGWNRWRRRGRARLVVTWLL